jgi:hypothetical protein
MMGCAGKAAQPQAFEPVMRLQARKVRQARWRRQQSYRRKRLQQCRTR